MNLYIMSQLDNLQAEIYNVSCSIPSNSNDDGKLCIVETTYSVKLCLAEYQSYLKIRIIYKYLNFELFKNKNLLLETASNLSDFRFRFHFHGLNNFPIENLVFLSEGGVLAPPLPRLVVLKAEPFCFLAETEKKSS